MSYYGVYIPLKGGEASSINNGANTAISSTSVDSANDVHKEDNETVTDISAFVFQKKYEALKVLKQHKDARFKEFLNEEEAIKFAQTGLEIVQNKYNDAKTSTDSLEKAAFTAPTKQQLVRFRQHIEFDDWKLVKKMIWENPRYLVSSGDTPTILKEGYRYNAMHVCAIYASLNVARLILATVSDPKFTDLLLGKKNDEKLCKELCANLLDYYLNLPEKGRNETPLHLAAKFGHAEIVAILTSYPECKMLRNCRGILAKHMICERKNPHLFPEVLKLLEERYFVPVLRCNDSTIPGQIGEPFLASNPPTLNCDRLTPEVKIKAFAGPMSQEQAEGFFRRWKTPPRLRSNVSSPFAKYPFISPMKPRNRSPTKTPLGSNNIINLSTANLKRRSLFNSTPQRHDHDGVTNSNDFYKLLLEDSFDIKQNGNHDTEANKIDSNKTETNNNNNNLNSMSKSQSNMLKTSLYPLTPLLKLKKNAFSIYRDQNIASPIIGSIELADEINDSLLNISDTYDSSSFKERHVKNTDAEKGLECIGRVLAKENNIEWKEYWDFLEEFVDIASEKGMTKLENYLAQRQMVQDQRNNSSKSSQKNDLLDDVCNALENAFSTTANSDTETTTNTTTSHQSTTPYTYVEKSLQVHARRMTKTIIHNIDNEMSIIDALLLELRRVKSLIYSFKEDSSYVNVNFKKVHSRIGNLVSMFLESSQDVSKQMKWKILDILQKISDEQEERREHMECVCSRIYQMLQHPSGQILPENVKTEESCSKIWSQENDCDCQWESNLSRKTSHRNRMEARYKNHQRIKQQEKLQKDYHNQQKVLNKEDTRNTKDDTEEGSMDEDEFWSDFGDSDIDENEVFLTPQGSPSGSHSSDDDSNKIFIYGNEPTKRDLDVLNAIFHINIDRMQYPNIYLWKSRITHYPTEEMDFFPSPRTIKKSHSFMATSSNKKDLFVHPETPTSTQKSYAILNPTREQSPSATATITSQSNSSVGIIKEPILQLPKGKHLFLPPGRTKSMNAISLANNTSDSSNASTTATTAYVADTLNVAKMKLPIQQQLQTQRPLTPLNKLRGLYSVYRECPDNSPLSTSSASTSPGRYNDLQ